MKHNAKKTDSGRHSRRDFLKSPAAAAVGASVAGSLTIARTAHAGGDETIKMALIGCGGRGTGAACQALSTRGPVKLWAMADMFRDRLEASLANLSAGQEAAYDRAAHQGFGSKVDVSPERRFVGFEAYKQAIDSGVDLVMLVTPPHFRPMHYEDGTKMFGQARSISGCWNRVSEHVHGTRGYAEVGRGRIEGASAWRFRASFPNPYQVEHDVLMDAIRQDEPHNEAEYAATSTMTAILGRMASYSGQMMGWDDAINSTVTLTPSEYAFDATPPVVADVTGRYPVAVPGITKVH